MMNWGGFKNKFPDGAEVFVLSHERYGEVIRKATLDNRYLVELQRMRWQRESERIWCDEDDLVWGTPNGIGESEIPI